MTVATSCKTCLHAISHCQSDDIFFAFQPMAIYSPSIYLNQHPLSSQVFFLHWHPVVLWSYPRFNDGKKYETIEGCEQSRVDVKTATGPSLLKLGRETKMAVFWSYFRDFDGAQKIKDLSESKIFFTEVFQKTSRFVLGIRCTLIQKQAY